MKKRIRTLTMGSILVLHLSSCQESLDYNFYDLKKIEPPVIKTLSSNEIKYYNFYYIRYHPINV